MANKFTVSVQERGAMVKEVALIKARQREIENKLKNALADEEKAVPFYKQLRSDLHNAGIITPTSNAYFILNNIIMDEERHRKELELILLRIRQG